MTKSKNKILSKGQYITLRRQGHDLLLVPTREGKREAKDFMNREVGSVRALTELLEDQSVTAGISSIQPRSEP